MNDVLWQGRALGFDVWVTGWKLVGYGGVLLFGSRWVVQLLASRAAGRPVVPRAFWYMSVSGSLLLLSYFILGKNDSVGVLANLFPAFTATYNLWLEFTPNRRRTRLAPADSAEIAPRGTDAAAAAPAGR